MQKPMELTPGNPLKITITVSVSVEQVDADSDRLSRYLSVRTMNALGSHYQTSSSICWAFLTGDILLIKGLGPLGINECAEHLRKTVTVNSELEDKMKTACSKGRSDTGLGRTP